MLVAGAVLRRFRLCCFATLRAGDVAEEILGDNQGHLQTDGYQGFEAVGKRMGPRHLGCMAYARRKFMKDEKAGGNQAKATREDNQKLEPNRLGTNGVFISLLAAIYTFWSRTD
ncbi:IS66 family transposase [Desulfovibrio sp. TomC]|uniref:IS66 family transposase n=1 Tax=Desulfovibrio sp. TomC TaxID=1562888 RepID=UPI00069F5D31